LTACVTFLLPGPVSSVDAYLRERQVPVAMVLQSTAVAQNGRLSSHSMQAYSLFSALDGRDFVTGDGHWRLEVFSVVQQPTNIWVQLRLAGQHSRAVTLRLSRMADTREALQALTDRLNDPPASHDVYNVA
jgi:hypothetical protein